MAPSSNRVPLGPSSGHHGTQFRCQPVPIAIAAMVGTSMRTGEVGIEGRAKLRSAVPFANSAKADGELVPISAKSMAQTPGEGPPHQLG